MRSLAYWAAALLSFAVALPPIRSTQIVLNNGQDADSASASKGDAQMPIVSSICQRSIGHSPALIPVHFQSYNPYDGGLHAPELIYPGALSRDKTSVSELHSSELTDLTDACTSVVYTPITTTGAMSHYTPRSHTASALLKQTCG